jgi:hypothetical protein
MTLAPTTSSSASTPCLQRRRQSHRRGKPADAPFSVASGQLDDLSFANMSSRRDRESGGLVGRLSARDVASRRGESVLSRDEDSRPGQRPNDGSSGGLVTDTAERCARWRRRLQRRGLRCFPPIVPMRQPTDSWQPDHLRCCRRPRLCRSPSRRLLVEPAVRSVVVVMRDVFAKQPPKMGLVQDDDTVEQLSTCTSDPTFGRSILPRRLVRGSRRFRAEVVDCGTCTWRAVDEGRDSPAPDRSASRARALERQEPGP